MNDLNDFFDFLKFPSISSEPAHSQDVLNCADWVFNYLTQMGMKAEKWETSSYPVIFASYE